MEPQPQRQLSSSSSSSNSTPSFSSYSSETLLQIAARVIHELRTDPHHSHQSWEEEEQQQQQLNVNPNDNDDDFEFAFVSGDLNSSLVSADDIFYNGQIRPTYPLFDRNLLNGVVCVSSIPIPIPIPIPTTNNIQTPPRRLSLRNLMFQEEREARSCSSSTSEADDLNGLAPETYCVWTPPANNKNKANSMGSSSSKRWKLRDLLFRTNSSDGKKERLLVLTPTSTAGNGCAVAKGKPRSMRKLVLFQ